MGTHQVSILPPLAGAASPVPKIIISYRRSDSDVFAGRIRDRLAAHFGEDSVFIDVDNIPFGKDFRVHIQEAMQAADAVLVIIGPKWLGGGRGGRNRINDAADPVRIEVETALNNRRPIVPILVGQTSMPKPEQLPDSARDLAFINAAPVDTGRDFHRDLARVIATLEVMVGHAAEGAGDGTAAADRGRASSSEAGPPRPTAVASAGRAPSRSLLVPVLSVAVVALGALAGWLLLGPHTPELPTAPAAQPAPQRPLADAPVPRVLPPAESGAPVEVVIDARQTWQKTSLVVRGSGTIAFRAAGTWSFNPAFPAVDGSGNVRFSTEGRPTYAFNGPGGREGQLIGRIGTGAPFIVGTSSVHFIAGGESGPVYLVINDDLTGGTGGAGLSDNSGSLTVTMQQQAR